MRIAIAAALCLALAAPAPAHDDFYDATISRCYDGDTCTADIDLGLGFALRGSTLRLYGIDAPEMRGTDRPAGIVARDWLRAQIVGRDVLLETHGRDRWGRLVVVLWIGPRNINAEMVALGLAGTCRTDGGAC